LGFDFTQEQYVAFIDLAIANLEVEWVEMVAEYGLADTNLSMLTYVASNGKITGRSFEINMFETESFGFKYLTVFDGADGAVAVNMSYGAGVEKVEAVNALVNVKRDKNGLLTGDGVITIALPGVKAFDIAVSLDDYGERVVNSVPYTVGTVEFSIGSDVLNSLGLGDIGLADLVLGFSGVRDKDYCVTFYANTEAEKLFSFAVTTANISVPEFDFSNAVPFPDEWFSSFDEGKLAEFKVAYPSLIELLNSFLYGSASSDFRVLE
jgi:hypothetical protein